MTENKIKMKTTLTVAVVLGHERTVRGNTPILPATPSHGTAKNLLLTASVRVSMASFMIFKFVYQLFFMSGLPKILLNFV
jgi:hypothetical protein